MADETDKDWTVVHRYPDDLPVCVDPVLLWCEGHWYNVLPISLQPDNHWRYEPPPPTSDAERLRVRRLLKGHTTPTPERKEK